ncbi:ABC transporter ATP-binding protein [Yoonia sp. SS1-5]|uniref:ABC transporter ATP-binding protein n=1 Tax=Yoonia rhodophyticola TaxID=3137370 RepID=A0AAN0MDV2_9RHOB
MTDTALELKNLSVTYPGPRAGFMQPRKVVQAVDDVSLTLKKGRTLGLVGESGSGKTTVARAIMRLVDPASGEVRLNGQRIDTLTGRGLQQARRHLQYVFQDPYSSLNPRERAGSIVRSPLDVMNIGDEASRQARVNALFELVGLRKDQQSLFPHQFSGGQRQRINIARALAPDPDLIVCDEAVSALDVAIQAQILNLLQRLKRDYAITYLFISHDLTVVRHMSDDVAVMYLGQIVEKSSRDVLFDAPLHPYTAALMSAVPKLSTGRRRAPTTSIAPVDPPSPLNLPVGCRFASRCPMATDQCRAQMPALREITPDHWVRCHLVDAP